MAHDYGVPLRVLSVTITRDNEVAPGNRLPDKHTRLFCGKTLNEWTMIQLAESKYITTKIFVCETVEHANKLQHMADTYGVELLVRPKEMLASINDTGMIPLFWATMKILNSDYHSLLMHPFVVSPCRPPGFLDSLVDKYIEKIRLPDNERGQSLVMGGFETDSDVFEMDGDRGKMVGGYYLNKNYKRRLSTHNHWVMASWFYLGYYTVFMSRHDIIDNPIIVDIEPWMDIHIDTEDHWAEAEFWFKRKILVKGDNPYAAHR